MNDEKYYGTILINDEYNAKITESEALKLKPIQKQFMESYIHNRDKMTVEAWLFVEIKAHLPEKNDIEVKEISNEIITTLKTNEEKLVSLEKSTASGRSKESWFANELKTATSCMSTQEASKYLHNLDETLNSANESFYDTLHTQTGDVSLNPNLDGYIAEQHHAQTFNLNAKATGSKYRAEVVPLDGSKNSVDIVIRDGNGNVVRKYQAKYYQDAKTTDAAYKNGDYAGQSKLVADGQEIDVPDSNNVIEAPGGTTSNPLSKQSAKNVQKQAQSGEWNDLNWNDYKERDLAIGIGKQAGVAALMGAAVGSGSYVVQKVWNGEKIDGKEFVKIAVDSGADFGVKAALAGALKVGAEKGWIKIIPKGTPAGIIANIVSVGVANVKVMAKIATGELSLPEGFNKIEQITMSTITGIIASAKGTTLGVAVGAVFGPVGVAVGGFVGGTIGYMVGSKFAETVVKGAQKVRRTVIESVKSVGNAVISGVKNVWSSLCSVVKSL